MKETILEDPRGFNLHYRCVYCGRLVTLTDMTEQQYRLAQYQNPVCSECAAMDADAYEERRHANE